jgi:hypothetical protein
MQLAMNSRGKSLILESSVPSDISEQNEVINSSSFAVASFDNLDKNQSYAKVVHGKDRSGFHGTTIQAA